MKTKEQCNTELILSITDEDVETVSSIIPSYERKEDPEYPELTLSEYREFIKGVQAQYKFHRAIIDKILKADVYTKTDKLLREKIQKFIKFNKRFSSEIKPLLYLGEYEKVKSIKYTGQEEKNGSKVSYDAIVSLTPDTKQKVELVSAIDGQNEQLQDEHLFIHGHAPAIQGIRVTGTRVNRNIPENQSIAQDPYGVIMNVLTLIENVIPKKCDQKYDGFWLGIVFDDWNVELLIEQEKNQMDIGYGFFDQCKRLIGEKEVHKIFKKVVFIGRAGRLIYPVEM